MSLLLWTPRARWIALPCSRFRRWRISAMTIRTSSSGRSREKNEPTRIIGCARRGLSLVRSLRWRARRSVARTGVRLHQREHILYHGTGGEGGAKPIRAIPGDRIAGVGDFQTSQRKMSSTRAASRPPGFHQHAFLVDRIASEMRVRRARSGKAWPPRSWAKANR